MKEEGEQLKPEDGWNRVPGEGQASTWSMRGHTAGAIGDRAQESRQNAGAGRRCTQDAVHHDGG